MGEIYIIFMDISTSYYYDLASSASDDSTRRRSVRRGRAGRAGCAQPGAGLRDGQKPCIHRPAEGLVVGKGAGKNVEMGAGGR
jgi:hypothetical protein